MGKKLLSSKTYQKAKKLSRIFGYISIALTIVGIFFPPALALGALFGAVASSLQIVQGEYEKQRNIPGGTTDMIMGGIGAGLSALDLGGTLGVAKGASRIADGADKVDYITRNMRALGYISMGINVGLVVGDEAYGAYEYITGDNKALGKSLMIQGGIQAGTMIGGAGLGYAIERSGLVEKFNMFIELSTVEPTIDVRFDNWNFSGDEQSVGGLSMEQFLEAQDPYDLVGEERDNVFYDYHAKQERIVRSRIMVKRFLDYSSPDLTEKNQLEEMEQKLKNPLLSDDNLDDLQDQIQGISQKVPRRPFTKSESKSYQKLMKRQQNESRKNYRTRRFLLAADADLTSPNLGYLHGDPFRIRHPAEIARGQYNAMNELQQPSIEIEGDVEDRKLATWIDQSEIFTLYRRFFEKGAIANMMTTPSDITKEVNTVLFGPKIN